MSRRMLLLLFWVVLLVGGIGLAVSLALRSDGTDSGTKVTAPPPRRTPPPPATEPTRPPPVPQAQEGETILWSDEAPEAALARAQAEKKPVFIAFLSNCPACAEMKRKTFPDLRVVAASRRFVCLRVDGPGHAEFAERCQVESYPTFVFFDAGENKPKRATGYISAENLLTTMRQIR